MLQLFQLKHSPKAPAYEESDEVLRLSPGGLLRIYLRRVPPLLNKKDKLLRDAIDEVIKNVCVPTDPGTHMEDIPFDAHFESTLKEACERSSGQPKLQLELLHVIRGMLDNELLLCDTVSSSRDQVTEAVCACARSEDAAVQLEVLSLIVRLVKQYDVHGGSLLACLRSCFLINKSPGDSHVSAVDTLHDLVTFISSENPSSLDHSPPASLEAFCGQYSQTLLNHTVLLVDPDNEEGDSRGLFGWCVECDKPADFKNLATRDPICSWTCKRLNRGAKEYVGTRDPSDRLLVFRALCKLSSTGGAKTPSGFSIPDSRVIKAKQLSLELILSMLKSVGVDSLVSPAFIEQIQHGLFVSLLTNSVSSVVVLSKLALEIFSFLVSVAGLRKYILREIGVFVDKVFIHLIESPHAAASHKVKVMEIFCRIMADPESAGLIFSAFDCRLGERNVFERSMGLLSKLATSGGGLSEMALDAIVELVVGLESSSVEVVEAVDHVSTPDRPTTPDLPGEKLKKNLLAQGLDLFAKHPKRGLHFLVHEHRLVAEQDIASFLLSTPQVDKEALGTLLGDPEFLPVLYGFIDQIDLRGMSLDGALRKMLALFRLPGEAQKIDRIMEKFAEKFSTDNPNVFASADAVYVLSFAAIMLNTDLHSAQVKKKMTIDQFVKLGKSINGDIQVKEEELVGLFRAIEANEIRLGEKGEEGTVLMPLTNLQRFLKETEQIVELAGESLRSTGVVVAVGQNSSVYAGMLSVGATQIKHALTSRASISGSPKSLAVCIGCLLSCLRLSIRFELDSVRHMFFEPLFQLAVSSDHSVAAIALPALVDIAVSREFRNGLHSDWEGIVRLASLVDKWRFLVDQSPSLLVGESPSLASQLSQWWQQKQIIPVQEVPVVVGVSLSEEEKSDLVEFLTQIDDQKIESIFINSHQLTPVNVIALARALVTVAAEEHADPAGRPIYSAQKLVELADFNMGGRIRIVWSRIWAVVAPFLVKMAGTDPTHSLFAIDALRQLAVKYLSKPELANYHFQADFLKPFVHILGVNKSASVVDLILSIVESLVGEGTRLENIKSGWPAIFGILATPDARVVALLTLVGSDPRFSAIRTEHFRDFFQALVSLLAQAPSEELWRVLETAVNEAAAEPAVTLAVLKGLTELCLVESERERAKKILLEKIRTKTDRETTQIFLRGVLNPIYDDLLQSASEHTAALETLDKILAGISGDPR